MIDIIYSFILNVLIGASSSIPGKEDLAVLITYTIMICIVVVLIKLVVWAFNLGGNNGRIIRR